MNRTKIWRTVQNSTWLLGGLAMVIIAFFMWIGMQIHQRVTVEKDLKAKDVPVEPEKVRFSPTLGMMADIVPELDINQDIGTTERAAEFRGASFIKKQSGNWTVHVMSVSQEEVIKSYLDKRDDREKFFYVRSRKPDQAERYVLVYGSFSSVGRALEASKTTSFDLPQSVKAYPMRFSEFKASVTDDVGSEDTITNLSRANQIYQVRLRSVPIPIEAPVAPTTPEPAIDSSVGATAGLNPLSGLPQVGGQSVTNTAKPTANPSNNAALNNPSLNNPAANPARPNSPTSNTTTPANNNPASNGSGSTPSNAPIADPFS